MKEEEIRKKKIFNQYLEMVEKDVGDFFCDHSSFVQVSCPACESKEYEVQFNKGGFDYVLCVRCGTLFVNPRPSAVLLNNFYVQSPSTQFWVNDFFKPVAEVRREKIFRPRAEYIVGKYGADPKWTIGDIGAGFGLFSEELSKLWPSCRYVVIEPSEEMSEICRKKGMEAIACSVEEVVGWDESFDFLTFFELFEHVYAPEMFLKKVFDLLRPGGELLLTTLNGEGFDIQLLWEKSKSVFPPHHLNFFNPRSIRILLEKCGFIIEEISTPGKLDWDILEGMKAKDGVEIGRFWKLLAEEGSDQCKQELQTWIAKNNFSSHMRVVARKG